MIARQKWAWTVAALTREGVDMWLVPRVNQTVERLVRVAQCVERRVVTADTLALRDLQ